MGIIETDQWLVKYIEEKKQSDGDGFIIQNRLIGENLGPYFPGVLTFEIHEHLLNHGLYFPDTNDERRIMDLIRRNIWQQAADTFDVLKKEWNGPDIPVFIFPADSSDNTLQTDFNSRSGLSFDDKLFLFVEDGISNEALKALLVHEYNHVCRLQYFGGKNINLLDTMVLEGLAEAAVGQQAGNSYLAKWTSYYPIDIAKEHWRKWGKVNLHVPKTDPFHDDLMYGNSKIPKWLGYNLGFHIVSTFLENKDTSMQELLKLPAGEFMEGSEFD